MFQTKLIAFPKGVEVACLGESIKGAGGIEPDWIFQTPLKIFLPFFTIHNLNSSHQNPTR